jgi:hypothetical protein
LPQDAWWHASWTFISAWTHQTATNRLTNLSTSQSIQPVIKQVTEWCTGLNAPTSKHQSSFQHRDHKHL